MRNKRIIPAVVTTAALMLLAFPRKASAYVDPGSGAMLWQMAAAGFIGALFYFRRFVTTIRKVLRLRSARATGFLFATVFAVISSPMVLGIFNAYPMPRFNDIFLVGVVLTAYLFTWEPAVYLLVISVAVSAYILPPNGSFGIAKMSDVYRLISFTGVSVLLIVLINRLKANSRPELATAAAPVAAPEEAPAGVHAKAVVNVNGF